MQQEIGGLKESEDETVGSGTLTDEEEVMIPSLDRNRDIFVFHHIRDEQTLSNTQREDWLLRNEPVYGARSRQTGREDPPVMDNRQPIYAPGVRTIVKSDPTGPQRFGRSWQDGPERGGQRRFTNTAVPRFDGTGCWQQHLLVFEAITKWNGWSPDTAALQLFAHLDGEALQVALLMPDIIRERWKDLVNELSRLQHSGEISVFPPAV